MARLTTSSVSSGASATKRETHRHTARANHVLITEQEVLFGTAAAVALPRRRRTDILSRMMSSALVRWQTRGDRRPIRHDHPSRLGYLEHSLMSREMDHL